MRAAYIVENKSVPLVVVPLVVAEAGSFAGGVGGGAAIGGLLSAPIVGGLCVGLGVVGGLVCGVVVVGGGSYAGSVYGAKGGEIIGEVIYESTK